MENYAPQFKDKTMAELEGMREKCAKRIGVLADPVMLNIIEQEIAVRKAGPDEQSFRRQVSSTTRCR